MQLSDDGTVQTDAAFASSLVRRQCFAQVKAAQFRTKTASAAQLDGR